MVDDQEQLRQHWQELAEQLGLDAPEQPGAASESKKDESGHASITEMEKTELRPIPSADQESLAGNEPAHFAVGDTAPAASKAPAADQFVAVSETSGDEPPPGSPEPPIDDSRRGRRGRRPEKNERDKPRRRRDSSPRPRDEAFPSEADDDSSEMNGPADPSETEFPEEIEPEFGEDSSGPEQQEEEDLEDMDVLTDWNVPSWAELIASLYRPDR
jgi:hypothetical protein